MSWDDRGYISLHDLLNHPVWHAFILGHEHEDQETLKQFAEYVCPMYFKVLSLAYLDKEWNQWA